MRSSRRRRKSQADYQSSFTFKTSATDTLNEAVISPAKSVKLALEWLLRGSDNFWSARPKRRCLEISPRRAGTYIQYQCLNFSTDGFKTGLHRWPGFTFIFSVCRPKSVGEITLRDAEGRAPPRIQANYLTDPDDMRIMLAAFRIARQIVATEPFRSLVTEQIRPASEITSDEQIADYVRKFGSTVYHPCGTCRIGGRAAEP